MVLIDPIDAERFEFSDSSVFLGSRCNANIRDSENVPVNAKPRTRGHCPGTSDT